MTTARIEAITRDGGRIISFDQLLKLHKKGAKKIEEYSPGQQYYAGDLGLDNLNVIILGDYTAYDTPYHRPQGHHSYEVNFIRLFTLLNEVNFRVFKNDLDCRAITLKFKAADFVKPADKGKGFVNGSGNRVAAVLWLENKR